MMSSTVVNSVFRCEYLCKLDTSLYKDPRHSVTGFKLGVMAIESNVKDISLDVGMSSGLD